MQCVKLIHQKCIFRAKQWGFVDSGFILNLIGSSVILSVLEKRELLDEELLTNGYTPPFSQRGNDSL